MKKIYGLICDSGDGSSHVRWFSNEDLVNQLMEEDEDYYANEGCPIELEFPIGLDLKACGFNFSDDEN